MAWAPIYKVVLGSIAFIVFWVMAVFPAVPFLPIGRTAGALLGAALMVVFQVESPTEAFAAIDLPILGLLFGTMAVSVYLERAELFKYLGALLSWKSQGGKDLLIRVCFLSALSSALFTNDTTCVILTGFVLKLCKEKKLRPQPFLIALASSSNIGSAATPIGNPQNLVIAVTSKISFGTFLVGILPAVAAGMVANTLGLLALYWGKLSLPEDVEGQQGDAATDHSLTTKAPVAPLLEAEKTSGLHSPHGLATPRGVEIPGSLSSVPPSPQAFMHPSTELTSSEVTDGQLKSLPRKSYSVLQDQSVSLDDTGKAGMNGGEISPTGSVKSRGSHATGHAALEMTDLLRLESTYPLSHRMRQRSLSYDPQLPVSPSPSGQLSANVTIPSTPTNEAEKSTEQEKEMAPSRRYKICVYGITLGMLAALLAGLNLSWCAITAAVALMVLDFGDAGPSLDQVSYSLLVFFSGMFIAVDGFNRTGAPGAFWNAVEPSSRINDVKGTFILALVVILLSNVASNVPTVLLLGSRVAASAASTPGASVTRAWLILAWVSTVAGNLTLVGSAANLIVSEQARRAQPLGYNLSFWNHLRFGVPSTFIVVAIGLFLVRG